MVDQGYINNVDTFLFLNYHRFINVQPHNRNGDEIMEMIIKKWGNSLATRIPKTIADSVGLEKDQPIEMKAVEGSIVISPKKIRKEYSLDELLKNCNGKSMQLNQEDDNWLHAEPVGKERI